LLLFWLDPLAALVVVEPGLAQGIDDVQNAPGVRSSDVQT
jgi:hypothetical protein